MLYLNCQERVGGTWEDDLPSNLPSTCRIPSSACLPALNAGSAKYLNLPRLPPLHTARHRLPEDAPATYTRQGSVTYTTTCLYLTTTLGGLIDY